MKHAILMTVYKDVELINRLIDSYPDEFGVFIHIDKKAGIAVSDIISKPNVHTVKKYKVNWGGYNHVKAMLYLLKLSMQDDGYDYYHWVTGQDVPINPQTFDDRLNYGYSYLEVNKLPRPGWCDGGLIRYQIYGFFDVLDAKIRWQSKILNYFERLQKKIHFIRPFRDYSNIYEGSGYFTLFKEDAKLLLSEAPKWEKFYRHTFCGEESVVQTILMNSNRKPFLINETLRFIEWDAPWNAPIPPRILTIADYEHIIHRGCLFARKVDKNTSSELLERLGI